MALGVTWPGSTVRSTTFASVQRSSKPEGGCVLALVNVTGRGAASGLPVSMHAASIIRVTDGEVTAIESHPDLAAAREALTRR